MRYKYPIGTRIRYRGMAREDVGKEGKIVGWVNSHEIRIVLLNSYVALHNYNDSTHPWTTYIGSVEVLEVPNEQLLFEFMY